MSKNKSNVAMPMPQVHGMQGVNRTKVVAGPPSGKLERHLLDKMEKKFGMATPADVMYCEQVFHPALAGDRQMLMPATTFKPNQSASTDQYPRPGVKFVDSWSFTLTAGTNGVAHIVFDPVEAGFSNQNSMLVTDGAYTGSSGSATPTTTGVGITAQTLTPSAPYQGSPGASATRFSVCGGLRMSITENNAAATSRGGKWFAARVAYNDGTYTPDSEPGTVVFDAAILTDKQQPEIIVSPEVGAVINNPGSGDLGNVSFAGAIAGLYTFKGVGLGAGNTFTVHVEAVYFCWGVGLPQGTTPLFSEGYWCALNCYNKVFQLSVATMSGNAHKVEREVKKAAEVHRVSETSGGFWSKALPWLSDHIPSILSGVSSALALL